MTLVGHHIPYVEQPANLLTKALTIALFLSLCRKLSAMPMPLNLRGVSSVSDNSQVGDR